MYFEAMNLKSIAKTLDGLSTSYILSKSDFIDTYIIEIPHNTDVEELNKSLSVFGLDLVSTTINKEFYKVMKRD